MDFTSENVYQLANVQNALEELIKPALIQARQKVTQLEYFPKQGYYNLFRYDYYDPQPFTREHIAFEEALGRIHPNYLEAFKSYISELEKCEQHSFKFHTIMRSWERDEYCVKAIALFAKYNAEGNIEYYAGTSCDITHEVFGQKHLIKMQRKADMLQNRYRISFWSYNPDTHWIHSDNSETNPYFQDYNQEKFIAITHPDYRENIKKVFEQMDNRCLPMENILTYMLFHDGSYHYYMLVPETLTDDNGRIVEYLYIRHDVTEEKKKEFRMQVFAEHVHLMTEESGIRLFYYRPGTRHFHSEDPLTDPRLRRVETDFLIHLFPEDLQGKVLNVINKCDLLEQKREEWIVRWKPIDDDTFHLFKVIAMPVFDNKGEIKEYGFMRIDITKENRQQEMLNFIQDVAKIGAWTYSLETERSEWTDQVYSILGITHETQKGMQFTDFIQYIVPEEQERLYQLITTELLKKDDFCTEYNLHATDGTIKHVEHRIHLKRNSRGEVIEAFGTLMDITERTQLAKEKEKADKLFATVLKSLPLLISIKDVDNNYRIIMSNDMHAHFFGKTTENMVGLNNHEYLPKEFQQALAVSDAEGAKHSIENPFSEIFNLTDNNGENHYFQNTKFAFTLQGKKLLISVNSDVTELQLAKEKAETNDRLKSAFIANMSHEIRTPLNAIVGFSDLIVNNASPENNTEFLAIIKSNSEQLLRLINDILDLSKIEANVMTYILNDFNISDMIYESYSTMKERFNNKGIELIFQPLSEPLIVHQDKTRVLEVLNNFLTNAYKNTEAGNVTVGIERTEETFKFWVKDTGKGIPEDKLGKIFERFEKLDSFIEGTGLGLSVSKAITEHLGGKIGVESEFGVGSTFWAQFPIYGKIRS